MKRIIAVVLAMLACVVVFSSCFGGGKNQNDPIKLAQAFDDEDYTVGLMVDESQITEIADEFEVSSKGIYCILVVSPEEDDDDYYGNDEKSKAGMFIYCEDSATAKKMQKELTAFSESDEDFKEDIKRPVVERSGKMVFVGSADAWEEYAD